MAANLVNDGQRIVGALAFAQVDFINANGFPPGHRACSFKMPLIALTCCKG
jgi:hypothetical protein